MSDYSAAANTPLVQRMIGAAMLNVNTYEEVEADSGATGQAATVVAIVAVASAIGAYQAGVITMVLSIVMAFVGWVVMSYVTYFVGTRGFGGKADVGELLRTLGFSRAPGILAVFGIVPILGGLVSLVAAIWCLVTAFIAIRQALDIDNVKAAITAVISWIVATVIIMIPTMILGTMFAIGTAATN